MAKITWLPSFETGILDIDNEHRGLVDAISKIEVTLGSKDINVSLDLIKDFLKLAADHFVHEEAFLTAIDFPRAEPHSATHKRLLAMGMETLNSAKGTLDLDDVKRFHEELIHFLLEDVVKADAEFRSYAQEQGRI